MSAHSTGYLFAEQSTCSAGASPASLGVVPGSALAQKTLATSGRNSLESFGKFSRVSLWAKTFAASLVGAPGFNSRLCVLTWKLKATTFNRCYFQLRASVPSITGIGSGLWPTPQAEDELRTNPQYAINRQAKGLPITLGMKVLLPTPMASDAGQGDPNDPKRGMKLKTALAMLPTPTAADGKRNSLTYGGGNATLYGALLPTPTVSGNHNRAGLSPTSGDGLSTAVKKMQRGELIAAPTARDWRSGKASEATMNRNSRPLSEQMGGSLNPRFVLQMMGFPSDYCDLESTTSPNEGTAPES
jgi:hypothetical protein